MLLLMKNKSWSNGAPQAVRFDQKETNIGLGNTLVSKIVIVLRH